LEKAGKQAELALFIRTPSGIKGEKMAQDDDAF
jgi:hypothetical protein